MKGPIVGLCLHGSRKGASLAEVLVAVSILAVGGAAATQLLVRAALDLDGAELGLRATLLLAEVERSGPPPQGESGLGSEGPGSEDPGPGGEAVGGRPAGPGRLSVEWEDGWPVVRYEPPDITAGSSGRAAVQGGYRESREWRLRGDP